MGIIEEYIERYIIYQVESNINKVKLWYLNAVIPNFHIHHKVMRNLNLSSVKSEYLIYSDIVCYSLRLQISFYLDFCYRL